MSEILLLVAILPVVLLGRYIYKKDKNKEPRSLLVKLFVSGILSCLLVLLISACLSWLFPFISKDPTTMNWIEFSFYIFVFIALTEETCKWVMTYNIGYKNREFDEVYDIVVYAVFVALGFAAFENLLYVFGTESIQVGVFRGLLAIPGHVCDGVTMGYYLSLARYQQMIKNKKETQKNIIKSILMPTLYHGIYDYCCLTASGIIISVFIIFIIFLYTLSIKRIKMLSQETTKTNFKTYFCPRCGNKVEGNFCSYCGLNCNIKQE